MEFLLEGTQEINNKIYPKQISTNGDKSKLGTYIRKRINVSSKHLITIYDLIKYGRVDIEITSNNNNFYFDFSV